MNKKLFGIGFFLLLAMCFFSCSKGEEDLEGKTLNLIGVTAKEVYAQDEMEFDVNIKGKLYSLFSLQIAGETISIKPITGYTQKEPEIALIGEFTSLDKFSENRYNGHSDKFSTKASVVNGGGYIVRMTSANPVSGESVQWVVKFLLKEYAAGKYNLNYALYATSLGITLPSGNEKPGDNTGNGFENEGDEEDKEDNNTEGFTYQGKIKDLKINIDNYEVISIDNHKYFSIANVYPNFRVDNYGMSIGRYIGMVYLGSNKDLNKINIHEYDSSDLEYKNILPIKEGSYLVTFRVYNPTFTDYTLWIVPMVVKLTKDNIYQSNKALNVNCLLYSVD
ncbi:MAG: hypothetical protein K2N05_01990 [Muribaculaceae bacterium]|nr:hypothetical protein [Muribaculaceae bacterium]